MSLEQIQRSTARLDENLIVSGTIHLYVAFDWGEEVDLEDARNLLAAEPRSLARRRRTPSSFAYSPPPLRFPLAPIELKIADPEPSSSASVVEAACRTLKATSDATLFDFGGASVAMHGPFLTTVVELSRLAACLADSDRLVEQATAPARWLFD